MKKLIQGLLLSLLCFGGQAHAASTGTIDLLTHPVGIICLVIFIFAYVLVILEEKIHLRKSKPVLVAAGIIWTLIAWQYSAQNLSDLSTDAFRHALLEFSELMLFLLVAMTYINALEERRLFDGLRSWLVARGFSYKQLFWISGVLAFCISPVADNLTTALLLCAVVMKVAANDNRFIAMSCVNIVIAANAGGAFSPFGDITTLMVWQADVVAFTEFFVLFLPALVSYIIPAFVMSLFINNRHPDTADEDIELKRGALRILCLFLLTILTAVVLKTAFGLPPVVGMMMGLGYLQFFGYFLRVTLPGSLARKRAMAEREGDKERLSRLGNVVPFDVFKRVSHAEWDTLLFFYGVVMCVGGLSLLGYLGLISEVMYTEWNPVLANIVVGILSAIVDNIPVMFAVLTMEPAMSTGNWLLVTLTAGVGGSLLSIGSAAGVALMGAAHGKYTFFGHLKWAPIIAVGYATSIAVHLLLNQIMF